MKNFTLLTTLLVMAVLAAAQEQKPAAQPVHYIHCGALVQPETGKLQHNVVIGVQGERISEVKENANPPAGARVIDLSDHPAFPA